MSMPLTRRQALLGSASTLAAASTAAAAVLSPDTRSAATAATTTATTPASVASRHAPFVVDVRDHGATGDGRTDDSAAVRAAIAQAVALGWALHLPKGTYVVSPDGTGADNYCLKLPAGLPVYGDGQAASTIRLRTGSVPTEGVIGPATATTDLSGLEVYDLTIDMNGAGNPLHATGGKLPGDAGVAEHKPRGICVRNGRGLVFQRVGFRNGQCVWYLELIPLAAGTTFAGTTVEDVLVDGCSFTGAGRPAGAITAAQDWDHTSLYVDGHRSRVTNNTFTTTNPYGARAAFELHGGPHHAAGNTITGYLHGIHVVGSQTSGPGIATVVGNTMSGVHTGFVLWSAMAVGHDHGLRDTTIANNDIVLVNDRNVPYTSGPDPRLPCSAVVTTGGPLAAFPDTSAQPWENITITGNTVRLDTRSPVQDPTTQQSSTFSFIRNDSLRPALPDRNLVIDGNTVTGSVAGGVRVSGAGSSIEGLRVTNNTFTGLGTQWRSDQSRNSAVLLSKLTSATDVTISRNSATWATRAWNVVFAMLGGRHSADGSWDERLRRSLESVRITDNSARWAASGSAQYVVQHAFVGVAAGGSVTDVRLTGMVDGWSEPSGATFSDGSLLADVRSTPPRAHEYVADGGSGRWVDRSLVLGTPTATVGTLVLSGSGYPGARITVTESAGTLASAVIAADGTWKTSAKVAAGRRTLTVRMRFGNSLVGSATVMVVVPR